MLELPDQFRVVIPIVAGIGNALLAEPMVRQLISHPKRPRVTVVALIEPMAEIFRRVPGIYQVSVSGKGRKGISRAIQLTREQRADLYLVPFPSNRWQYNLLAAASGAKRVLMHGYTVGSLSTLSFLSGATRLTAERGLHDVVQNLRLLKLLGLQPDETDRPRFVLNDEDRERANELLGERRDFIAIHAGSAQTILAKAKRWPADHYASLIKSIRSEFGQQIVMLEGPDEAGVASEIVSHLSPEQREAIHIARLNGPLGLAGAVLQRAKLYVGSDSGLAHLAAAVGTRAVTLFAPADPNRVSPSGNRDLVIQPPCDCSPCLLYPWESTKPKIRCREPMCITRIEVPTVVAMTGKALNR